jgi:hypothetical protein
MSKARSPVGVFSTTVGIVYWLIVCWLIVCWLMVTAPPLG